MKINCEDNENKVINEYQEKYHPKFFVTVTNDTLDIVKSVLKIPSFSLWNL